VGNVANAVLAQLEQSPYENLTAYTEVIQDGMLSLLRSGRMTVASATAFSLSPTEAAHLNEFGHDYGDRIVLRPRRSATTPNSSADWACWP
jgi:succinyl-CoA:acetate CoA-transferase